MGVGSPWPLTTVKVYKPNLSPFGETNLKSPSCNNCAGSPLRQYIVPCFSESSLIHAGVALLKGLPWTSFTTPLISGWQKPGWHGSLVGPRTRWY